MSGRWPSIDRRWEAKADRDWSKGRIMSTIHGPRLPSSGDIIQLRLTALSAYCGPFITRSGMRCRPSHPAWGHKAVTTVPMPADLHYSARER